MRLQLDGHKAPNYKKRPNVFGEAKKVKHVVKRRKLDPDHPDFDSEEEYGGEQDDSEDSEEDDDHGEDDYDDEEPELDSQDDELVSDEETPRPIKAEKKERPETKYTVKQAPADEYLVKREATLISLLRRSFK